MVNSKELLKIYDDRLYVAEAMEEHAGSFFSALGTALRHADIYNAELIMKTWPKEWHKYLVMGKKKDE